MWPCRGGGWVPAAAARPLSVRAQSPLSGGRGNRLEPAGRLHEHVLAHVLEELRSVVADRGRARELAAVQGGRAEGLWALERRGRRLDAGRRDLRVADLVEELVD